jgi:hypothetical protein
VSASLVLVPHAQESSRPDVAWIKKRVPVLAVGRVLGLQIRRGKTKCWRPENHTHGDANPSLCFFERGNRVRCFVCDMRGGHSNIDLVTGVRGISFGDAVRWIAERFPVPNVKPGRPVGHLVKEPQPYRVGVHGSELELLVRSGIFGQLSSAESRILVTLYLFRDTDSGVTHMSYVAIMRYAGVGSRKSVSGAIKRLQRLRALQISRGARVGITRECSAYRVTLDDPKFQDLCNQAYRAGREQIAQERAYRLELRTWRERTARKTYLGNKGIHFAAVASQEPLRRAEEPSTCEGLNLSSPREPDSNKSVLAGNRETDTAI